MKKINIALASLIGMAFVSYAIYATADATSDAAAALVSEPQAAIPPNIASTSSKPMMMLATSKDHTLFGPIYTDFEDIDDDGVLDTTFKPSFKYYGYFDSSKCYSYTSNSRFEPDSLSIKTNDGRYTCPSSKSLWSGNFLNWATMTRIDVIRKMLYGGKRFEDGVQAANSSLVTTTVLERANLSKDSHSFVKHYVGSDIRDYTPFTVSSLTKTSGSNNGVYSGLTICNRSDVMGEGGSPIMRLAKGNYRMWGTVNGTVCEWNGTTFGKKLSRYFKDVNKGNGGIAHEENQPTSTSDYAMSSAAASDLNVRVRVCNPSLLGEERCQAFPATSSTNFKPYGIFQEFGLGSTVNSAARSEFGVITGSYDNNLTAGALRRNMGDFSDEINQENGVFCHSTGAGCSKVLSDGRVTGNGAIKSMDGFVLYGRNSSNYDGSNNQLPNEMVDGTLSAWGNPVGEMVVQALQYFSGKNSTNPATTTKDTAKGLSVVGWNDPLSTSNARRTGMYGNPICRPMYTLALSSSALSFDAGAGTPFETLPNRKGSLNSYVNTIGDREGIHGTQRSVGSVDGSASFGQTCSKKTVSQLSSVSGICPEAPAIGGTYQVAGAALYANTSKIRNITNPPSDLGFVQDALKVKTMAASLAGGVARIEVPIPNTNPRKYVYITPESLWNSGGSKTMPGAMLTFQSISSGPMYGTFVVTWNDALFGGDYDMDIAGFIRYDIINDSKSSTGYSINVTTDIINVGAGFTGTHGFSIMGTDKDGRYLTHRHKTDEKMLKGAEGYLCDGKTLTGNSECNVSSGDMTVVDKDYPVTKVFQMQGVSDALLQDPLWYAAKYGYFASSRKNSDGTYAEIPLPENQDAWDHYKSDGSNGSDGVPDGYFLARRPEILENQLRRALEAMANTSNAAPAMSAPVLVEGAFKYAVKFDSNALNGELEAYKIQENGTFGNSATWEASKKLQEKVANNFGGTREIITNDGNASGLAFRWASMNSSYKSLITTSSKNKLSDANAQLLINYIRGDQSLEGAGGLRVRGGNMLGPIISSSPWLQQRPVATWGNVDGYSTYYNAQRSRKTAIWVGSNDGMLHAFASDTGEEIFSYVPGAIANRLAELPLQRGDGVVTKLSGTNFVNAAQVTPPGSVWAYVDGNPYTADVKVGADWRTYLFGSLGRGGRAVFALDASNISNLTERNASSIFKWQFTSADDADMGYQIGDVTIHGSSNQASPIARLNNGKFAMIIGNGQRSVSGKAVLYLLYVDGPSAGSWSGRYKKIVLDAGSGNGLSSPRWEDLDGDGTADVVYAGDLKGNIWKVNISDSDALKWKPAFSDEATTSKAAIPLFTANDRKMVNGQAQVTPLPITTAPQIVYMARGGVMVNFATGNAFVAGDFGSAAINQAAFGIWDRGQALPNARILSRKFVQNSDGSVSAKAGDAMDWSKYDGWTIPLPGNGEAVVSDPLYDAGVFVFVGTKPKNQESTDCSDMPRNMLYAVDPISGMPDRATLGVINVNGLYENIAGIAISDPKVGGPFRNSLRPPKVACVAGDAGCTCTGGECSKDAPVCGAGQRSVNIVGRATNLPLCYSNAPRLQWREISGLRTYP